MMKNKVIPTDSLLDEMEQLVIKGGSTNEDDPNGFYLFNCNTNTYCGNANCVSNCGINCMQEPKSLNCM